jgi:hypothetical protein
METQDKTYPDLVVTPNNQAKESRLEPGLTRRVLATTSPDIPLAWPCL